MVGGDGVWGIGVGMGMGGDGDVNEDGEWQGLRTTTTCRSAGQIYMYSIKESMNDEMPNVKMSLPSFEIPRMPPET